jgi:hypothetical protein
MTVFQRCALSIVAHAWCKELDVRKPSEEIRGQYIKVYSGKGKLLQTFDVRTLSLSVVDLAQAQDSRYKFFSDRNHPGDFQIKSEDVPDGRIKIYERYPTLIKGKDCYNNWFTAEVKSWYEVKIDDDENRQHGTYTYRIEK